MRVCFTLLLGLTVCSPVGLAQVEQQLAHQLVGQTLVLRNYYTAQKLKYDAMGTLTFAADSGVGPADGSVYVESVQLQPKRLLIRGERPISMFNPGTGEISSLDLHRKVEIEAELPSDRPLNEAATKLVHRIFLTPAEADALACSTDEEKAFRERMLRVKEFTGAKESGNQQEPRRLCFPDGSRALVVANGVVPPRALNTLDLTYPPGEVGKHGHDEDVILALIVDSKGKTRSVIVIGGLATIFDEWAIEAVQRWKFEPAAYQGRPVAVAINVEVNFTPCSGIDFIPEAALGPLGTPSSTSCGSVSTKIIPAF